MRPRSRFVALVALVLSVLTVAPAEAYHRQRQAELENLIERQEDRIQRSKRAERSLLSQLDASDRRREILETQLRSAQTSLVAAEAELARIEGRLRDLDDLVRTKTAELEGLLADLYAQETIMRERIAEFYIHAPSHLATRSDIGSANDAISAFSYTQSVFEADAARAEAITAAKDAVSARRTELQLAQTEVTEIRNAQERETEKLANAAAAVERAAQAVEQEIETKASLLKRVRSKRAEYVRILKSYEKENARVTAFLQAAGSSGGGGSTGSGRGSGEFVWPVSGPITSPYGWRTHPIYGTRRFHTGIDIGVGSGTPIAAATSGRVIDAGYMGAYGISAIVDHGNGLATLYAHMSALRVSTGQSVSRGDTVGLVGSTGYSTGPHLHFEVRVNGAHQNPMNWL